ncbi:AAA family ATPase, partial [Vibrio parahaemolyticus]|nr:AAA family ATPase [Vibrio parahaemolyticus]
ESLATQLLTQVEQSSRFRGAYGEMHLKSVLKRLVNRENQINFDIVSEARDSGDVVSAMARNASVIATTNHIFEVARLSVRVTLHDGVLKASRGNNVFTIDRLSDGERAALLLVGAILIRPQDSLIAIDEPEKHLHPGISGPLIATAVRARPDLGFLISTHDLPLIDWLSPSTILHVRDSQIVSHDPERRVYDVHLLTKDDGLQVELRQAILGSRKALLFVEGEGSSDDKALYSLIYKGWNVVARGGWETVVASVRALRSNSEYLWLTVSGLIDNDGRDADEQLALLRDGIHSLSLPTVENLFCLKEVIHEMAALVHGLQGGPTAEDRIAQVEAVLPGLFENHKADIIARRVVWISNRLLSERKVSVKSIHEGQRSIQ